MNIIIKRNHLLCTKIFSERLFSASISTSLLNLAGGKFRRNQGEAADALAYGPFTDLPDFTFVDKTKPVVVTKNQKLRQMKRVQIASDIKRMLEEIDGVKKVT